MPIGPELRESLLDPALDHVLEEDNPQDFAPFRHDERRAALFRDVADDGLDGVGALAALRLRPGADVFGRALADRSRRLSRVRRHVDAAHARLGREGHKRMRHGQFATAQFEFLLGEDHDAPPFGGFIRQRGELGGLREPFARHAGRRQKVRRLPVAERDGSGLVEQEHIDVAGRLDRPAGHREDVALEQPVHARDPDGAQQSADRRRDEANEQRNQRRDGKGDPRIHAERFQRNDDEQKDHGKRREENRERKFVGRLLPRRALDEADHVIEKAFAGIGRDADHDSIREHGRPARDRAAIAAGFADNRGGLARDRRFVDGRRPFDDLAVAGDLLARRDDDDVAFLELRGIDGLDPPVAIQAFRHELFPRGTEGARLRLAAALGDGFRKVRKHDGEQQPQRDLQHIAERFLRRHELLKGEERADERDEHDRILELRPRVEFLERIGERLREDRAIKEGNGFGAHGREDGMAESKEAAGPHEEVLDDGPDGQGRQMRERADEHDGADEQHDEGQALRAKRARARRDQFLRRQIAGERQDRNDHQEAAKQHGEARASCCSGYRRSPAWPSGGEGAAVVADRRAVGVEDFREAVRPRVVEPVPAPGADRAPRG